MRLARVVLLIAVLAGTGCAGVERRAYDRAAHGELGTVGLLDTPPSSFRIDIQGHPATAFGLVGGLIAAGHMEANAQAFASKMKDAKFDPVREFNDELAREIAKAGYTVKRIPTERKEAALLASYAGLDPAVDAYVDTAMEWSGYFSKSPLSGYIPAVRVKVRVVKRDGNQVVYEDLISYGWDLTGNASNIPADPATSFQGFDALVADPERAAAGLRAGISKVVAQFLNDVSRK